MKREMKTSAHFFAGCNPIATPSPLIAALAFVLLALCSCSKDDLTGFTPESHELPIVRNTLTFGAQGGTESVEVETADAITAELSAGWCTATINGRVVSVTAQANNGYEGRTAILTLKAGAAQRQLAVQQKGSVIGILPVENHYAANGGATLTFTIAHDPTMTVSSQSSWIHPTMAGNQLTIVVDDNSGGHIRRGMVVSECAGIRDSMLICQYDMENDIVGSYYMAGTYGGVAQATRFDIIERNDSLFMHFTNQTLWQNTYIPVQLERGTGTLIFQSAMVLYNQGSTTETAYFYDTNGTVATSGSRGASAMMEYRESTQFNQAVLEAYNWPGHKLGGFLIRSSSAGGLVVSNLLQLNYPTLSRVGPVGTVIN